jgi:hypothetical protein
MPNNLTESQVQEIAEDYLKVMVHMGEFITDLDNTLDKVKEMIRMTENPLLLVNMMKRYRVTNKMEPYNYTKQIK